MQFIISAPQPAFAAALEKEMFGLEGVSITAASILDLDCDAIVSPANSYGFMDGGIDAVYTEHFGEIVQTRVRENILYDHYGELLVGSATIVETDDSKIPFLIAAPTMRVPMWLGAKTVNPFLAMRAVILMVREGRFTRGRKKGKPIKDCVNRIAIPGLGTGVGGVPFPICTRQIAQAIAEYRDAKYWLPQSWSEASENHIRLYSDKIVPLQK
ncbi:MAG: macro domain-containing protein, partial [Paracoccaceae bacterium]